MPVSDLRFFLMFPWAGGCWEPDRTTGGFVRVRTSDVFPADSDTANGVRTRGMEDVSGVRDRDTPNGMVEPKYFFCASSWSIAEGTGGEARGAFSLATRPLLST